MKCENECGGGVVDLEASASEKLLAKQHCLDMRTPLNKSLSALYKRSFAYYSVKERVPLIITQIIDHLCRNMGPISAVQGSLAGEEIKEIIGKISELKYEVQTNKTLKPIEIDDKSARIYNTLRNDEISNSGGCTYFTTVWLHSECYIYRKIREIFQLSNTMTNYDPFRSKKEESASFELFEPLSEVLMKVVNSIDSVSKKREFINLLKLSLWGNKVDLSLSLGVVSQMNDLSNMELLNESILCDSSVHVWNLVSEVSSKNSIDIILDNAGYELFTDLCLADYLITAKLVDRVRFHCKDFPWFISDVLIHDFKWLIREISVSKHSTLAQFGVRWTEFMKSGKWTLETHYFWTLPVDYTKMLEIAPELYAKLAESKMVIFKGDLNYRKLYGEINWEYSTPIDVALQGFHPTSVCSLRTVKADIVCGLKKGVGDALDVKEPLWKTTGNYGLIQYCDRTVVVK